METEEREDVATQRIVDGLAALLDHHAPPWPRDLLPPLAHWLLFPPTARQSLLGTDGHPHRDEEGLPRRMWGGSRIRFVEPIAIGATVSRRSTVLERVEKDGRQGRMVRLTLLHELSVGGRIAVREEQDIVYLAPAAGPPAPVLGKEPEAPVVPHVRPVTLDSAALFRFSALTFNAHRIHYDRDYARTVEGYPGLVVHGPLAATLLMDHYHHIRPDAAVTGFSFRAHRPLFENTPFDLCASGDDLWCRSGGQTAVTAQVAVRTGFSANQSEPNAAPPVR